MEWQFILGLGAITLAVIGLFVFFGIRISRAVQKDAPDSDLVLRVTMTGTVLYASLFGFWVACLAARALQPASALGSLVSSTDGLAATFIVSFILVIVVAGILEKLGYPITKKGRDDH